MKFIKAYYSNSYYRGKPVKTSPISKMGNWRSRWERYRDINNKKRGADVITKINTKATRKDYIVTSVYGHTADKKLKFKITPIKEKIKQSFSKNKKNDYCKAKGCKCPSCIRSKKGAK